MVTASRHKRVTPIEEFERFAERLVNTPAGQRITDKDSYDLAYKKYMEGRPDLDNQVLKDRTFEIITDLDTKIDKKSVFKQAGGKSLKQDRKTTAKKVTTSKREYIALGSQRADLKGLDDKRIIVRIKRSQIITRRGKKVNVFRDSRGRFVRKR